MIVSAKLIKGFTKHALLWTCICLSIACREQSSAPQNKLAHATSPYLREHADNPVDWHEWNDETLALAKKTDKPLLISVGYAACHWCHEMEKESFMDTAVARLMNENFVCIKVDREERPDIDQLYLQACSLLNNGQAGWPLNAFALPDGKPFFAGTYFTKDNWMSLLQQISTAYKTKRNKVNLQAVSLNFGMIDQDSLLLFQPAVDKKDRQLYQQFFASMLPQVDTINGGIRAAQKFPTVAVWELMLQYHYYSGDQQALQVSNLTLKKMALSGLYDQVGGGFARYTTDSLWMNPHFEKMLYDNAQLISLYAHAYQVTNNSFFKTIALETLGFVERELSAAHGGFYSSVNADTEEGEGAYYRWNAAELSTHLGGSSVEKYLRLKRVNNEETGVLFAADEPAVYASLNQIEASAFQADLQQAKAHLFKERSKRTKPSIDSKMLVAWNALMIKAYTDASVAFGEPAYLRKAKSLASFLEGKMLQPTGQLWRNQSNGKVSIAGFLDDYALFANALVQLYEASFDKHWLQLADRLLQYCRSNFYDQATGFFFFTDKTSSPLALRKIELRNNTMPVSNASLAVVLYKLGLLLDRPADIELARTMLSKIKMFDAAAADWGLLAGLLEHPLREVAIMGKDALQKNHDLQKAFLPDCLFMGGMEENLPLLQYKLPNQGTMIYVCTNKTCQWPVESVDMALQQIHEHR